MPPSILTASKVARLVRDGAPADISDGGVRGLQLRVRRADVASWAFAYKRGGTTKRLTLGAVEDVTLAEARERATEARRQLATGIDPVDAKREAEAQRAAELAKIVNTLEAEQRHAGRITVAGLIDAFAAWSDRECNNPAERIRTLRKDVAPIIGTLAVADVTADDCAKVIEKAEADGHRRKPSKVHDEMRAMFNYAVRRRHIPASPMEKIERPSQPAARTRFLSVPEIRAFLITLPSTPMTEGVRNILRLQLRLGARVSEIGGMRKREINLEADAWTLPGRRSKNGQPFRYPLPPGVRSMLIRCMEAAEGEFLFPSKAGGPFDAVAAAKALLRSQPAFGFLDDEGKPAHFSTHDLRRTVATHLEKLGVPEKVIGAAILNHKSASASVTGTHYTQDALFEEAYTALCRWELVLEQIEAGGDPFRQSVEDRRARAARMRVEAGLPILKLTRDDEAA